MLQCLSGEILFLMDGTWCLPGFSLDSAVKPPGLSFPPNANRFSIERATSLSPILPSVDWGAFLLGSEEKKCEVTVINMY